MAIPPPPQKMKYLHSPLFVYVLHLYVLYQYSNNHKLVKKVLRDLGLKFVRKTIICIPKNRKHQIKGTPDASVVNKLYSITTLSKVLIMEPDYLYFHYLDTKGTKEIQMEKIFNFFNNN